jgi:3' terminal RNA ribose 2'-O-methyltransferase Hen1
MLLTLSTTHRPATDLGFLLHKNPERAQVFQQSFGPAYVYYPQASEDRCTAALLIDIDPIELVRGAKDRLTADFSLGQYVNDRPYAASSLLASALGRVFRTAMRGDCVARPELAAAAIPLEIVVPALPCRGGAALALALFEPLGWAVDAVPVPLDPAFPAWGDSRYVRLTLHGTLRLADALSHLYVLLPVLDDAKHYWVGDDEVDKLIRAGGGWLAGHPARDLISRRYLAHRSSLTRAAIARLAESDDVEPEALDNATEPAVATEPAGAPVPLAEARRTAILDVLRAERAHRVVDVGCGSGALLTGLLDDPTFTEIVGTDVSARALELAARRLRLDRMPQSRRDRLRLLQSSVVYRDARLAGYDAHVLMEVIEHVDPPKLPALAQSVFGAAQPRVVVITTPNVEHNVRFAGLADGSMRHSDHRFEWTRAEFTAWCDGIAAMYGYAVRYAPVGVDDAEVGAPTQMAVFSR